MRKQNPKRKKQDLAKKLLSNAVDTEDDAAGQFVLFQMARDLAAESGDVETALEAIDHLEKNYEIDTLEMQAEVVTKAAKASMLPADERMIVVQLGMKIIDRAVALDQYQLAIRVATAILPAVRGKRRIINCSSR